MEAESLLELVDVSKVFLKGTVDEIVALDCVHLNVFSGDYVTIIGSNGAGKTTLLNIIAGTFPPEKGCRVIVEGVDVTQMREYKHASFVGRVFSDPRVGTATGLTVEENMALALLRGQRRGLKKSITPKRRELFREALAALGLGLEDRLSALVGTLSSGQRQAVALVMSTLTKPSILLLDEHVANLDPRTARTVLELTDMLIERENMTALMVTHNMEVALRFGSRLLMMHRGRIVADIGHREKRELTVNDLVDAFEKAAGEQLVDETILLSRAE